MSSYAIQANWRWCHRCGVLTYQGQPSPAPCAAGGGHDVSTSGTYYLAALQSGAPGSIEQLDWKYCSKCEGLAYAGAAGICPADRAQHDFSHSWNFALTDVASAEMAQPNWRWCNKCGALAYAGAGGVCPADGGAHASASDDYSPGLTPRQWLWRWCSKCQALSSSNPARTCPAGDVHDFAQSWHYGVDFTQAAGQGGGITPLNMQSGWQYCHLCGCLPYMGSGSNGGHCAANGGAPHNVYPSAFYVLMANVAQRSGYQDNWRWCSKCQQLVHGGGAGVCPADHQGHNHASANYSLPLVAPTGGGGGGGGGGGTAKPDLAFVGNATAPSPTAIYIPFKNIGTGPTGPFAVKYFLNGQSQQGTSVSLAAGAGENLIVNTASLSVGGHYSIQAVLDADNQVNESNENNNSKYVAFNIEYDGQVVILTP